jgi:predicted nucleic acid-binding protein
VALIFLDSSALVKLIVTEPESAALTERAWPDRISSALALTLGRTGWSARRLVGQCARGGTP